jgi:hypothetical protein
VSLTERRFAVSKKATAKVARVARGTTFRLQLSESATVKFVITYRTKSTKCPSHHGHRPRHCTRTIVAGTLTRKLQAGKRSVPFSGRIGRRALSPRSYTVTITGTDAAGNRSKPTTLSFTIVRG